MSVNSSPDRLEKNWESLGVMFHSHLSYLFIWFFCLPFKWVDLNVHEQWHTAVKFCLECNMCDSLFNEIKYAILFHMLQSYKLNWITWSFIWMFIKLAFLITTLNKTMEFLSNLRPSFGQVALLIATSAIICIYGPENIYCLGFQQISNWICLNSNRICFLVI